MAANLARRGFKLDRERYLALETERKELQTRVESLRQTRNERSKAIGRAKAAGGDVDALKREVGALGDELSAAKRGSPRSPRSSTTSSPACRISCTQSVPAGADSNANVELRRWGTPPKFAFEPLDHVALGEKLGLIDFDAAAKLSGARFVVLKGAVAHLHRAIAQLMLDMHTREHGYSETYVPYLVNDATLFGTGQLPKFAADLFALEGENKLRLIPTAEVSLTNLVRDTIVEAKRPAAAVDRAHAVLPLRGGIVRAGHARHDPPASVRQGRARAHRAARGVVPRARGARRQRRGGAEAARSCVPRRRALRRRHRLRRGEDLRPRGLAAGPGQVPRDLLVQQLRSVPSAAHASALAQSRDRQARARAHAERLRSRRRPHARRHPRKLPAARRLRRHPRSARAPTWAAPTASAPDR